MFSLLHLLSLQVFFSCLLSLYGVYWLKCAKDDPFLIGHIYLIPFSANQI